MLKEDEGFLHQAHEYSRQWQSKTEKTMTTAKEKTNRRHQLVMLCLMVLIACTMIHICPEGKQTEKKQSKNGWYEKNGKWLYYSNGRKVRGKRKFGKHFYFFSEKGVQLTGWRLINGKYYYFRNRKGKKGYMLANQSVDEIPLDKNGSAKCRTKRQKRKVAVMAQYRLLVDRITRPEQSNWEKLRSCYDYLRNERAYIHGPDFSIRDRNWDLTYAEEALDETRHDCYPSAAAMAYMALAIGYQNVEIRINSKHGWAEVKGMVLDVPFGRAYDANGYGFFGISYHDDYHQSQLGRNITTGDTKGHL